MAELKVSPANEGTKAAEVPLLDHESRIRTLETTASAPTLHQIATREPTSFHQATIYNGLVRTNTPAWRKFGLLAASIVIVFLQCFVAGGFSISVGMMSCSEHSECGRGMFCDEGICDWCASYHKPCCHTNATDTCAIDFQRKRLMGEKDREGMCAACTSSKGFETFRDVGKDRVKSMRLEDWLALSLASLVVSFALFGEIRDVMLCGIALHDISTRREVPRGWRFAIGGLNFARYFIFLPNIVLSITALVLNDGGTVKNTCLNTVAVLFLVDVDNMAFRHGLGERVRMEAEENVGARHLTDDELRTIDAVKAVCVVLIPCVVIVGVRGFNLLGNWFGELTAPLPFIFVVLMQRVRAHGLIKGSCYGLGWGLVGYVVFWLWYSAIITLMVWQSQGEEGFTG